jgi:hypothetical protein
MTLSSPSLTLPELFEAIGKFVAIDPTDWHFATRFAEKWKVSVADALLDLHFLDETALAKALAAAHELQYVEGSDLQCDFSEISFEDYDDLLAVGAAPLNENRLAICNPYDDHRGFLGNRLCAREMVVTERSQLYEALRKQGLERWLDGGADD